VFIAGCRAAHTDGYKLACIRSSAFCFSVNCLREFAGSSMLPIIKGLLRIEWWWCPEGSLVTLKLLLLTIETSCKTPFPDNFSCCHFYSICVHSSRAHGRLSLLKLWNEKKHYLKLILKHINSFQSTVSHLLMIQHYCCKHHRASSLDWEQGGNISSLGAFFLFQKVCPWEEEQRIKLPSTTTAEVHIITISLYCGNTQRYHQRSRPSCWGSQH